MNRVPMVKPLKSLVVLAAAAGGVLLVACSGDPPPAKGVALSSTVQTSPSAPGACNRAGPFLTIGDPSTGVVDTGTAGVVVECSVKPNGANFDVSARATVSGGANKGTITIIGSFAALDPNNPKARSENIRAIFQDETITLDENDCYAMYTDVDNATLDGTPITNAGIAPGRVWASVFCPNAPNKNDANQSTKSCQATAEFRFENCDQGTQ